MFTKEAIYELKLEDYSTPRYMPAIKSYYGPMSDIIEFMNRLDDDPNTSSRYKDTLDAAEFYDLDNEVTHTVAGQTLSVFTPVNEISRLETTQENAEWTYKAFNGTIYPCKASNIIVRQSLVQSESGYELCVQANIIGLQVCYPCIGWICPNGAIKGFPGMVTFSDNSHCMALSVSQAHYDYEEYELAMVAAMDPHSVDLSILIADIIGEG